MSNFYEWLAKLYDTNQDKVKSALRNEKASSFLIIWSIFEQKCFGGFLRQIDISDFSKINASKIDTSGLHLAINHFYIRYQNKKMFKNLIHSDNAGKYQTLLSKQQDSLSKEEQLEFLIYVIYRFRNNIFHGNKGVMSWVHYEEEINYCIDSMMIIIDNIDTDIKVSVN